MSKQVDFREPRVDIRFRRWSNLESLSSRPGVCGPSGFPNRSSFVAAGIPTDARPAINGARRRYRRTRGPRPAASRREPRRTCRRGLESPRMACTSAERAVRIHHHNQPPKPRLVYCTAPTSMADLKAMMPPKSTIVLHLPAARLRVGARFYVGGPVRHPWR